MIRFIRKDDQNLRGKIQSKNPNIAYEHTQMHNRFRNKHFPFSPSSTFLQRHIPDIQSVLLLSQPEIPPLDNTTAGALKKKGRGGGGLNQTHPDDTSINQKTGQQFWLNQDSRYPPR